ncbi:MAG: TIGR00730 family Rossman fold protein [Dehalococcoidia bacterium]|nr:TIGR00730 family Rossman fold protein [Dehalococcoidia bacterium]
MKHRGYEINELAKEESWRMFRIMGEMVEGFDKLSNIGPAITIYGSARTSPDSELYRKTEELARLLGAEGFAIITGGGPGVMEAANKGAAEAGVVSVGLNIKLPEEQACNIYANRSITFNHFFVRKVMLVKYASAFIIMPGGLGTLDEMTEVLTLMQTHKIVPFPVILFDSKYWAGLLDWMRNVSLAQGLISEEDFELLRVCDEPAEAVAAIKAWTTKQQMSGKKALTKRSVKG